MCIHLPEGHFAVNPYWNADIQYLFLLAYPSPRDLGLFQTHGQCAFTYRKAILQLTPLETPAFGTCSRLLTLGPVILVIYKCMVNVHSLTGRRFCS